MYRHQKQMCEGSQSEDSNTHEPRSAKTLKELESPTTTEPKRSRLRNDYVNGSAIANDPAIVSLVIARSLAGLDSVFASGA